MPGTRYPNAEGHPPPAPLQRGEERSEALGKQATSQRRAESLNEYGFRRRLCHSEHSEESRGVKGRDSSLRSE